MDRGIISRSAEHIFQNKLELESQLKKQVEISFSYLEIYNESIRDLLDTSEKKYSNKINLFFFLGKILF